MNIPNISISKDRWIEIERFTFFHFCPTLIYRDSYPRIGTKRRWDNILYNLFNIIGAMIFTYIIFQTSCVPNFKSNWNSPWSVSYIIDSWFKAMIPGTFLLVLGFFGILHSWQNMWAEIILFADRCFYEDWWNVSSFATYYRKWNMVVHEFLYYYILQDLNRFTNGRVTVMQAYAVVFLISAWVHEYIIIVSFKIFYPVLLIMFGGPGVIYTFIPRKDNNMLNIFVWIMFFIGNGFLLIFYSWEYFARQNIDLTEQYGWYGFFIPHSLVNTDLGS